MRKDDLIMYLNKRVHLLTNKGIKYNGILKLKDNNFYFDGFGEESSIKLKPIKASHIKKIEFDYDVNTLIIPDIHLKTDKILDHARTILDEDKEIKQVIFLGDYFDDWGLDNSYSDYKKTITDLFEFSLEYPCHFLIGNHDVPYLTGKLQEYSSKHPEIVEEVNIFLNAIKPKVAIMCNGYLLSHAGFINEPKKQDFKPLNIKLFEKYEKDESSPLWIRPFDLLTQTKLPKQIVGHTPVGYVKKMTIRGYLNEIIFTDVFSTTTCGEQIGRDELISLDTTGKITYHKINGRAYETK